MATGGVNFNQICPGCGSSKVSNIFSSNQTQNSGSETTSSQYDSYLMSNAPVKIFPTNNYSTVIGDYSINNFSNGTDTLLCLLTPSGFGTTGPLTSSQVDGNNKILQCEVIFGVKYQTSVKGVVNAGFQILESADFNTAQDYEIAYLGSPDGAGNYNLLELGTNGSFATVSFYKVDNNNYNIDFSSKYLKISTNGVNLNAASSRCQCVLDDVNFDSLNSRFNGSINFNQECGSCEAYNSSNQKVSCADSNQNIVDPVPSQTQIENQTILKEEEEKYTSIFFIILSIMVATLILYFILSLIGKI